MHHVCKKRSPIQQTTWWWWWWWWRHRPTIPHRFNKVEDHVEVMCNAHGSKGPGQYRSILVELHAQNLLTNLGSILTKL